MVVPLYAAAVGLNAAEIGLMVAARSALPAVLSIRGGILMDQLGTTRGAISVRELGVAVGVRAVAPTVQSTRGKLTVADFSDRP